MYSQKHEDGVQAVKKRAYSKSTVNKRNPPTPGGAAPKTKHRNCKESSPVLETTAADWRQFEEAQVKYGVTSETNEEDVQIDREKMYLLHDTRLPLNNCGSKYVLLGVDPFNGFAPALRILKKGVGRGAYFTTTSFEAFIAVIPEILSGVSNGNTEQIELLDYTVCNVQNGSVKLVPRHPNSFELYIATSTLARLQQMSVFLISKLNDLNHWDYEFKGYCSSVAWEIENKTSTLDTELLINVAVSQYGRASETYYELIFKFPTFVKRCVQRTLDYALRTIESAKC